MKKLIIATLSTAFLGAGAHAAALQQDAEAAAEDVDSTERIVCRRMPPPTGSRVGARRICQTERQWDTYDQESREYLERMFNRSKTQDNES